MVSRVVLLVLVVFALPERAYAGLYYSGERTNELPAQWRGFLLDQKTLRSIAAAPKKGEPENPVRGRYMEEATKLERKRDRSADEIAELGALYVRLGEVGKAIGLLRPGQAKYPNHFHIAANLGTAWQLQGDLAQAAAALEEAVRLAPGKYQAAEEAHLRLVRHRLANPGKAGGLDDLFGVAYVGDGGKYKPGVMSAATKKKLPARSVALTQYLALWLPADGPLLWQLAELASAHGDIKTAAAMMDGCVVQFAMTNPELRSRRKMMREAAGPTATGIDDSKTDHSDKHTLVFRSRRPLLSRIDLASLPAISVTGVNELPWPLIQETVLDRKYRPNFPKHLRELDGKEVRLVGFMQPLKAEIDMAIFLFIEYPVGCWFCETPEPTSIVLIEMEEGQTAKYQRGLLRVIGRLKLNEDNPEDFLYSIVDARVAGID